jgi:hypothetical protein
MNKIQIMKDMNLSTLPITEEQFEIFEDFHGKFGTVIFGFSNEGKSYAITDDGVLEIIKNNNKQ